MFLRDLRIVRPEILDEEVNDIRIMLESALIENNMSLQFPPKSWSVQYLSRLTEMLKVTSRARVQLYC